MELPGYGFRAMGTKVRLVGPAGAPLVQAGRRVKAIFADLEARFSRFRDDSELSALNRGAGDWVTVSAELGALLRAALAGARRTGGLFDPTVLHALVAAGYDRDFVELAQRGPAARAPQRCGRWREVEVRGSQVRLPAGVGLDLGGLAKGWAVDRAADEAAGILQWALVDAGGDMRVGGSPPSQGLEVALEDPASPGTELLRVRLTHGALATSSVARRKWGPGLHHLIDPRTSCPAATGVVQATAWSATCTEAEILAKQALLGGPGALGSIAAVLVVEDGGVVSSLPERTAGRVA